MIKKTIFTILIAMLSLYTFAQCPAGQTEVSMDISTDNWGYETYLELVPIGSACGSGAAIFIGGNSLVGCNANSATSGGYSNNTTINAGPWCLNNSASYDILSRDGYGDGGAGFVVNLSTMPLYNFSASAANETFTFTVTPPPPIDDDADTDNNVEENYNSEEQKPSKLYPCGGQTMTPIFENWGSFSDPQNEDPTTERFV